MNWLGALVRIALLLACMGGWAAEPKRIPHVGIMANTIRHGKAMARTHSIRRPNMGRSSWFDGSAQGGVVITASKHPSHRFTSQRIGSVSGLMGVTRAQHLSPTVHELDLRMPYIPAITPSQGAKLALS